MGCLIWENLKETLGITINFLGVGDCPINHSWEMWVGVTSSYDRTTETHPDTKHQDRKRGNIVSLEECLSSGWANQICYLLNQYLPKLFCFILLSLPPQKLSAFELWGAIPGEAIRKPGYNQLTSLNLIVFYSLSFYRPNQNQPSMKPTLNRTV